MQSDKSYKIQERRVILEIIKTQAISFSFNVQIDNLTHQPKQLVLQESYLQLHQNNITTQFVLNILWEST